MQPESWRRLRRACPLWTPLWLYRWVCDRQHEAILRERNQQWAKREGRAIVRLWVSGSERRARP